MSEEKESCLTIPCHDIVSTVEFAPFEWCPNLLAVGTSSRVTVYAVSFEEETEQGHFQFDEIRKFQCGCQVTALSWSPDTAYGLTEVVDCLRLAVAGSDKKIQVITSDLKDKDTVQILDGHSDFINSVTYSPESGETLASTGDDLTCRLWDQEGEIFEVIQLSAPGMSVCIHEKEPRKVMVAQKNGIIKIFSLDLLQQIMSLDCGVVPLMAADWNRLDEDLIAVVAGTEWLIFQISRSSQPQERRPAHTEGARDIRWARSTPTLLSTTGRPGRQIKVFSTRHHQVPLTTSQLIVYGMSWHYMYPLLAVGGDQQIKLFPIEPAKTQMG